MAGFKAHMTGSTLVGIGYGAAGYAYGVPWPTCAVAGLACSVSGMLPDLDSASGKPAREILCLLAAVVPALMIPRFLQLGLQRELTVLAIALIYLLIRYGIGAIFRHYTVHRGMWHSIPAAAVAGLAAFILVSGDYLELRLFKAVAVVLGFICHLVMDEMWSVDVRHGRFKGSFGTALKFYTGISLWSNISVYAKLIALIAFVIGDPYLMNQLGAEQGELPQSASEWLAHAGTQSKQMFQGLLRPKGAKSAAPVAIFERPGASPGGRLENPLAAPSAAENAVEAVRQNVAPLLPAGSFENPPTPLPYPAAPGSGSARRPFYYPGSESPVRR